MTKFPKISDFYLHMSKKSSNFAAQSFVKQKNTAPPV